MRGHQAIIIVADERFDSYYVPATEFLSIFSKFDYTPFPINEKKCNSSLDAAPELDGSFPHDHPYLDRRP